MDDEKREPFYSDGKKVSALASTIVVLGLAFIVLAICLRIAFELLP